MQGPFMHLQCSSLSSNVWPAQTHAAQLALPLIAQRPARTHRRFSSLLVQPSAAEATDDSSMEAGMVAVVLYPPTKQSIAREVKPRGLALKPGPARSAPPQLCRDSQELGHSTVQVEESRTQHKRAMLEPCMGWQPPDLDQMEQDVRLGHTQHQHGAPGLRGSINNGSGHQQQSWLQAAASQEPGQHLQQQQAQQGLKQQHPLHVEDRQPGSHLWPRAAFRHQTSWRPWPLSADQEDACASQQQELGRSLQASQSLTTIKDLLHASIGLPVLSPVHIALALTQVRRLMGADSRYATHKATPFSAPPIITPAFGSRDVSNSFASSQQQATTFGPSKRGWAQTRVQGGQAFQAQGRTGKRKTDEAVRVQMATTVDLALDASLPLISSFGTAEVTASLHALARLQVHTSGTWSAVFLEHARMLMPKFTLQQLSTLSWSLGTLGLDPGAAWLDDMCLAATVLLRPQTSASCTTNEQRCNRNLRGPEQHTSSARVEDGNVNSDDPLPASLQESTELQVVDLQYTDSMDSLTDSHSNDGSLFKEGSGSCRSGPKVSSSSSSDSLSPTSVNTITDTGSSASHANDSTTHRLLDSPTHCVMHYRTGQETLPSSIPWNANVSSSRSILIAASSGSLDTSTHKYLRVCDLDQGSAGIQGSDDHSSIGRPGSLRAPSNAVLNSTTPFMLAAGPGECSAAFEPYHLVNMAWGLARLQHNVPAAWTCAYHRAMRPHWHRLRAHALSNAAWAGTVLGLEASPSDMKAYCDACFLRMGRANAYDLSTILWSLANHEVRPSRQWMDKFLAAALRSLPSAEPRHVARMLWALAKLRWRPSACWAARVFQQTELQAFEFDGQACSLMLWAVSSLGLKPSSEWLEVMLVAAFEGGLADYGPQELTNLLTALGRWRFTPEYAWMDLFWGVSFYKLSQFQPQELVSVLCAAVKIGHHPPSKWLSVYLKVVGRFMLHSISLDKQHAPSSTTHRPGQLAKYQRWLGEARDEEGEPALQLPGYSRILASLAALEAPPSQRWMAAFFEATKPQLRSWQEACRIKEASSLSNTAFERNSPREVSAARCSTQNDASAAAQTNSPDPGQVNEGTAGVQSTAADLNGTAASMSSSKSAGTVNASIPEKGVSSKCGPIFEGLLTSLATLHVQPPADWLEAFFDASLPHVPRMHPRNLDGLAYSAASLELQPNPQWSHALVGAIEYELTQAQARGEKVGRTSLGKSLFGLHWLAGPDSAVYQRWRDADWIGSALELYAYKRKPRGRKD